MTDITIDLKQTEYNLLQEIANENKISLEEVIKRIIADEVERLKKLEAEFEQMQINRADVEYNYQCNVEKEIEELIYRLEVDEMIEREST